MPDTSPDASKYEINEDMKLYANWEELEYNVTLNMFSDTSLVNGSTSFKRHFTERTILPTASEVYRPGWKFGGWYEYSDYTGTPVTEIEANTDENKTFYLKMIPLQYKVTFKRTNTSIGINGPYSRTCNIYEPEWTDQNAPDRSSFHNSSDNNQAQYYEYVSTTLNGEASTIEPRVKRIYAGETCNNLTDVDGIEFTYRVVYADRNNQSFIINIVVILLIWKSIKRKNIFITIEII